MSKRFSLFPIAALILGILLFPVIVVLLLIRLSGRLISFLIFRIELKFALLHARPKVVAKLSLQKTTQADRERAFIAWLKKVPNEPDPYRTLSGRIYLSRVGELATMPKDYPYLPWKEKRNLRRFARVSRTDLLESFKKMSTHLIAKETLLNCLEGSKPFALYLRGFKLEALATEWGDVQKAILPGIIVSYSQFHKPFEEELHEIAQKHLPIISVAHPDGWVVTGGIPKLEVPNDQWPQVVTVLIEYAALIIIGLESSPGLLFELNVIRENNKQNSTIIVKNLETHHSDSFRATLHEVALDATVNPLQIRTPDTTHPDFDTDEEITDFPHVISDARNLDDLICKLSKTQWR